jgi:hypothetical protein
MREHSIVSDQLNFVDVELIGESTNEPVPLRIFPVCTTSQISGGCHFVTTMVSKRPSAENFGWNLWSGPVNAEIEVPAPSRICEVTQTFVCSIQLPCDSQSAIAAQARSWEHGRLIVMRSVFDI